MINQISNNDNLRNLGIQQNSEVDQIAANKNATNPIKDNNKMLIDGYNFSTEAIEMYQKEQDIIKFTSLAMSNPEDNSHIQLVAQAMENNKIDVTEDDDVLSSFLDNEEFLNALGE